MRRMPLLCVAVLLSACGGGNDGAKNNSPSPPSVSLAADPQSVEEGSSIVLTWSSERTSSCNASGDWAGTRPGSGSETVGPLSIDASFVLTCNGLDGSIPPTATATALVSVILRPAAEVVLTLTDDMLAIGESVQVQIEVLDAEGRDLVGRDVTWSSSDPTVANVSDDGVVNGTAIGVAMVTASVDSVSSTVQVTVSIDGAIRVLGDRVINLNYPSLFDVFTVPDPQRHPNIKTQPDNWQMGRILTDLSGFADIDKYDFVLVWTSQEVPAWINAGPYLLVPAKNIGRTNSRYGAPRPYERLRATPHMNWVQYAIDTDQDFVLVAIHEMAHHWGVFMVRQSSIGPREWVEGKHHVSYLASCCAHWTFGFFIGQRDQTDLPSIMYSGPSGTFNPFDLYAMGLMEYWEASAYSYLIAPVPDPPSAPHKFYEINLDLLIEGMRISQPWNVEGDGKRIPTLEPEATELKVLAVVVSGESDTLSSEQIEKLNSIATGPNSYVALLGDVGMAVDRHTWR